MLPEAIQHVKSTGRAVVLTQRGRSAAVLIGVAAYQALLDELDALKDVHRGLADIELDEPCPTTRWRPSCFGTSPSERLPDRVDLQRQESVQEEAAYIRDHTSRSPRDWIQRILERVRQVGAMPLIGPVWCPGAHLGIRQLTVDAYVVLYRVDDTQATVFIVSVRHGRRSPPAPDELEP